MAHTISLYHYWRSSSSWRIRWALELKSVPYQSIPVNLLKAEHKTPSYLQKSPAGLVPCLDIDGFCLSESMAMIEWLEEAYSGPSLLPQDPTGRARVRELAYLIAMDIQPVQNLRVQKYISNDPGVRQDFAKHWIELGFEAYENRLASEGCSGTYSYGGQVSYADLCLIPQCYNANRFGVNLANYPLIKAINDHCLQTPACDKAAPHNQPGATP